MKCILSLHQQQTPIDSYMFATARNQTTSTVIAEYSIKYTNNNGKKE